MFLQLKHQQIDTLCIISFQISCYFLLQILSLVFLHIIHCLYKTFCVVLQLSSCFLKLGSPFGLIPGGSDGKASAYIAGGLGSIPGSGRSPGEGNGNPLQYSCLKNPINGGALVGYSPWGRKESDTTERLHFLSLSLDS